MVALGVGPQEIAEKSKQRRSRSDKTSGCFLRRNQNGYLADRRSYHTESSRKCSKKEMSIWSLSVEIKGPFLYLIVATGNIYEDITQAVAAAKQELTSSQLSVQPDSPYWIMYHMVQLQKVSVVLMRHRRTSVS